MSGDRRFPLLINGNSVNTKKQFFSDKFSPAQRVIQKLQILNALQQLKFRAKFKTEIFAVRLPF